MLIIILMLLLLIIIVTATLRVKYHARHPALFFSKLFATILREYYLAHFTEAAGSVGITSPLLLNF